MVNSLLSGCSAKSSQVQSFLAIVLVAMTRLASPGVCESPKFSDLPSQSNSRPRVSEAQLLLVMVFSRNNCLRFRSTAVGGSLCLGDVVAEKDHEDGGVSISGRRH